MEISESDPHFGGTKCEKLIRLRRDKGQNSKFRSPVVGMVEITRARGA
jgi:hypothetical protein